VTAYRERLWVPPLWWLLALGFSASLWLAYHHAYGPRVSIPVGLGSLVVIAAGLIGYGRTGITVTAEMVTAGKARLPVWAIGEVTALDREQAEAARGRAADPRAYLLLRGYTPEAVRIEINDPADPVPYWFVSSRRPGELAAALTAARDAARDASLG
jgi:hypothetical protein